MTSPIRLRQHTDGRVAVKRDERGWRIFGEVWHPDGTAFNVSGPGWSELFVAELPEPDGHTYRYDKTIPHWDMRISHLEVEDGDIVDANWGRDVDELRSDALKMLAAVAACERYRAEWEAAPATSPPS